MGILKHQEPEPLQRPPPARFHRRESALWGFYASACFPYQSSRLDRDNPSVVDRLLPTPPGALSWSQAWTRPKLHFRRIVHSGGCVTASRFPTAATTHLASHSRYGASSDTRNRPHSGYTGRPVVTEGSTATLRFDEKHLASLPGAMSWQYVRRGIRE